MAKPIHVPVWATAAVYTTNPDPVAVGEDTKLDPGSLAVQGWTHVSRPNPRHFNYWMNEVGAWLGWADTDVFSTEGGTYTLSNVLALGSNGLTIWDAAELTITSDSYLYLNGIGTITATGSLVFASGADMVMASGANFTMTSGSTILGNPNFAGGTWEWASPQVVDSTLTFSGVGHMRSRTPFNLNASGSQTIGINNGDEFVVPPLSATLLLTLSTTGAGNGSRMRINAHANLATTFSASVTTVEGTYLLRADPGGSFTSSLDVVFYGGAWHTSANVVVP